MVGKDTYRNATDFIRDVSRRLISRQRCHGLPYMCTKRLARVNCPRRASVSHPSCAMAIRLPRGAPWCELARSGGYAPLVFRTFGLRYKITGVGGADFLPADNEIGPMTVSSSDKSLRSFSRSCRSWDREFFWIASRRIRRSSKVRNRSFSDLWTTISCTINVRLIEETLHYICVYSLF